MSPESGCIIRDLVNLGDPSVAAQSIRFFKTGKGQYGEGDRFLGIRVPVLRLLAREHQALGIDDVLCILQSPFHEARLLALLILVLQYRRANDENVRNRIYRAYLAHTRHINNWDLVDCSAEHIVGAHLFNRSRRPLYRLVKSADLWERRIAVMATFHFIRHGDFADTLALCRLLLDDTEDLIHKASGWMLREVGNRDRATAKAFLDRHAAEMPRTMLRYAIEKLPARERERYLKAGRRRTGSAPRTNRPA